MLYIKQREFLPEWENLQSRLSHLAIVGTCLGNCSSRQSCVGEKRLGSADFTWALRDTLVGAIITVCIAGARMLVGNDGIEHKILYPASTTCPRTRANHR
jgi:hypothetical protein